MRKLIAFFMALSVLLVYPVTGVYADLANNKTANANSFEYLYPTGENLTTIPIDDQGGVTRLNFERNDRPIIYANYPEQLGVNGTNLAIAENGYCINQQVVTAGEGQIFFSHWNRTGSTLKYRVHIFNMSPGTTTVVRTHCGFSSGWTDPGRTVKDFFKNDEQTLILEEGDSAWLTPEYSIPNTQPFNGMIRFYCDQAIIVTLYAYYDVAAVDGTEVVYPYGADYSADLQVYSGIGQGYFLTENHETVPVSEMPYRYITNMLGANDNEITSLHLVGTDLYASENAEEPLNNLGNWCTQYYHTMTLWNDTDEAQTVYGYIGSNSMGNTPVVAHGEVVQSAQLENGNRTWKWCQIVLQPGESYSFDFQTILSSYGAAPTFHLWSTDDLMK